MTVYDDITVNFESLVTAVMKADIIFIDGFTDVGKQQLIELLDKQIRYELPVFIKPNIFIYRPDYDKYGYADFIDIQDRHILRLPVLEFFNTFKSQYKTSTSDVKLIMDKSVVSDIVKGLLHDQISLEYVKEILSTMLQLIRDHNVCFIHASQLGRTEDEIVNLESILQHYASYTDYLIELAKADSAFAVVLSMFRQLYPEDTTKIRIIKYLTKAVTDENII